MTVESPKARLWIDGCFDGFHFAHANAVRQSRKFGDYVIVGVHSDHESNDRNKGPTLFDERERRVQLGKSYQRDPQHWLFRYDLIRGCRWVNEVAEGSYYVCHGDDPVLVSTVDRSDVPPITQKNYNRMLMDCYENAKKAGKYKEYPRTCVTIWCLLSIILMYYLMMAPGLALWKLIDDFATSCPEPPPIIDLSDPNNRHDTLPRDNPRDVVYIGASWDVFGARHVELLRRAHQTRKDAYLVVGVWGEQATWDECGERPLLDTLERVLAVLQCRVSSVTSIVFGVKMISQYTSAVIIDAPVEPTAAFLSEVTAKFVVNPGHNFSITNDIQVLPVSVPKLQTINELRERLKDRKDLYSARQKKKRT
ncbi:cytidylyltransferase domain-containing protein [Rhizoctonia solani AG-1 IA]|uniref:ethanolamine-phosphate cytidylyltransferase n=1 Tax=Thanatephorus cucumeris (strain AG1-IA) TaxID=983506 RepID=L8X3S6_THACA|nr:cytidylyltransferase domain-containing protein [Rhizoctonia solani AG-1 IA]